MGTRADFYVGRGEQAEWLGSIAWDGYLLGIDAYVTDATTEDDYRKAVACFLKSRNDATMPEEGWPWPWVDSSTTDYAYAFDAGKVYYSEFGCEWVTSDEDIGQLSYNDFAGQWENQFGFISLACLHGAENMNKELDYFYAEKRATRQPVKVLHEQRKAVFPNMKARQKVKLGGAGSGLIICGG